jgi:Flp pilus assembly protein TadD
LIASLGSTSKPFSIREVGGAFVSKATLVSAVVSVGVLTLEWEWYVGALVVLLLYAHELGHVIAALVRGVAVHRAPFFLPGLGAFVQTAPGATHWDDVWVSLGGPLFGGACALAVKVAGVSQGSAALMQAGDVGLWLNVINLAPFSPLDGGRVATRTGWLGLALTVTLGVFLLTRGVDFILIALIGYGAWQAFAAARTLRIRWSTQLGVLAIYLGSVMLLLVAAVASGPATLQRAPRPDWLPGLSEVFSFMFWFYVAGSFVVPYALADARGARTRYGLLAVFGWTRFVLNGQHWIIPLCGALFAEACGLGGLRWVEGSIARLARQGDPRAGEAASLAFDSLRRQGRNAEQWLMGIAPVLKAGGPRVLGQTYLALIGAGYRSMATTLLRHSLASGELAEELGPRIANDYAWQLLGNGAAAEALPYARAAATVSPESPNILDTLGQVLLVLGEAEAAEQPLRASLVLRNRPGTRFALARSLAAQGRIAEAIAEGEAALEPAAGNWSSTEITVEQARAEIQQWRTAAVAVE